MLAHLFELPPICGVPGTAHFIAGARQRGGCLIQSTEAGRALKIGQCKHTTLNEEREQESDMWLCALGKLKIRSRFRACFAQQVRPRNRIIRFLCELIAYLLW